MKLLTAAEMRELDRRAIAEVGIPSLVLMENAGRSTYQVLRREFPELAGEVAVLAGRGNNGGDGFVVARCLANAGTPVAVFLLGRRDQVGGDARVNLEILAHQGLEVVEVLEESHLQAALHRLARASLIVDALLGTGLNSPVTGLLASLISQVNHLKRQVLAVDLPSGLSADTGEALGVAVQAEVTVTCGWPKIGLVMASGRDYVGRLWQADLGMPPDLAREAQVSLAEARELRALLPSRPWDSHKGTFGHLLVLAGSEGKTGAAALASRGGLRAGAGLVTLGVAESLNDIMEVKVTEAMTLPLPQAEGARALGGRALQPIEDFAGRCAAVALGPGLGTHPETRELVRTLVQRLERPMVVDADGINALAGDEERQKEKGKSLLWGPPALGFLPPIPGSWPACWAAPLKRCSHGGWRWPGRPPANTGWCWSSKGPRPWWPPRTAASALTPPAIQPWPVAAPATSSPALSAGSWPRGSLPGMQPAWGSTFTASAPTGSPPGTAPGAWWPEICFRCSPRCWANSPGALSR